MQPSFVRVSKSAGDHASDNGKRLAFLQHRATSFLHTAPAGYSVVPATTIVSSTAHRDRARLRRKMCIASPDTVLPGVAFPRTGIRLYQRPAQDQPQREIRAITSISSKPKTCLSTVKFCFPGRSVLGAPSSRAAHSQVVQIRAKSKGGIYVVNNATGIKRLVEQALELLASVKLLTVPETALLYVY